MKIKITYTFLLTALSSIVAFLYVQINDGFGQGDVIPFILYSSILAIISSFLTKPFIKLFSRGNSIIGFLLAILLSVAQTIVFVYLLWFVLGPWIGAISFPFQFCWLSGALLANFYLLIISNNKFGIKQFGFSLLSVSILLGAMLLFNQIKDAIAKTQNFDIICLVHKPSINTPTLDELMKYSLTKEESAAIIELGVKGNFWADTYFRIKDSKLISTDYPNYDFDEMESTPGSEIEFIFGNKLDSFPNLNPKIIIIMNHPLEKDFKFNEPLNSSMIAIQSIHDDSWETKLFAGQTNSKKMIVKKTNFSSFPYSTSIVVDLKGRKEYRIHGFQWLKKNKAVNNK